MSNPTSLPGPNRERAEQAAADPIPPVAIDVDPAAIAPPPMPGSGPQLERLQAVDLQPGDTIIATLAPSVTRELAAAVEYDLMGRYPDNDINVLPPGVSLHVMRPAPPAAVTMHQHVSGDVGKFAEAVAAHLPAGWRYDPATYRPPADTELISHGWTAPDLDPTSVNDTMARLAAVGFLGQHAPRAAWLDGGHAVPDDDSRDLPSGRVLIIPIPDPPDEAACTCTTTEHADPQCPRHTPEPDAEWPR